MSARSAACALLAAWCLGLLPGAAGAQAHTHHVLIVYDGLSAADLRAPDLPNLRALAARGSVGLLNCSTAPPRGDLSAALTLALGAREVSEASDAEVYAAHEPLEGATAAVVLTRRTGQRSLPSGGEPGGLAGLVHVGIAPLARRGLAARTVGHAAHGHSVFVCDAPPGTAGRAYGLLAAGETGSVPGAFIDGRGLSGEALGRAAGEAGRCAVVRIEGSRARLDACLGALDPARRRILVVSPHPEPARDGRWRRLTPMVLAGPGVPAGLLASGTTRTGGLAANVDIAPTLRGWLGAPAAPGTTGHPLSFAPARDPLSVVDRLDRAVRLNAVAEVPVFIGIGAVGIVAAAAGLLSVWKRERRVPWAALVVLALLNMPSAMLLAAAPLWRGAAAPDTVAGVWAYGGAIGLTMLALAVVQMAAGKRASPPALAAALGVGLIAADAVMGQPLVKLSLLSSYQVSGIRFYGIGNEYMGVMVGSALLAAFSWRRSPWGAAWLVLTAVALGHPALGADAGGLVTALVALGLAWHALRGRRATWLAALLCLCAGLCVTVGVAMLDRALAGASATHLGRAVAAGDEMGWQVLWAVAERKAHMNARIAAHPGMVLGVAILAAFVWLGSSGLRQYVEGVRTRYPGWWAGLPVAAWAALAALLLNDSGVVAAAFLFGYFAVTGLWFVLHHGPSTPPQPDVLKGKPGATAKCTAEPDRDL